MFSVTPSELVTIGIIALIIFGPQRLPDLARRAGKVMAQLRSATDELRSELERDLADTTQPFREAAGEFAATKKSLKETVEGQLLWVDKPDDAPQGAPAAKGPGHGETEGDSAVPGEETAAPGEAPAPALSDEPDELEGPNGEAAG